MEKKVETKNWRSVGEEVLLEVCKELKLTPERVAQKSTSNQLGALRVKLGNQVAVAVRATDIIAYNPHSYLGYGYPHEGDWGVWITKLQKCSREEMKKAMVETLKNKTLPHTYRDNGKFSYKEKANAVKSVTEDAVKAQEKKLAEMKAALKAKAKESKKQKKDAKPKTKRANVLATVAATVAEPTVA